jgi:precorrin-6Y C5,15-methyltransferase (decarboxylating)
VPERVRVVGMVGDTPVAPVDGDLIIGGRRHLDALTLAAGTRTVAIEADIAAVMDAADAEPGRVCVLASGDPGFFGIVRPLAARFGSDVLDVHPAPSSVALAFARIGRNWDDATVISAHGRPLTNAAALAAKCRTAVVLVSPTATPEMLGKELLALGSGHTSVAVCTRLGMEGESVTTTDLPGLAEGTWDPLSVVVLLTGPAPDKALAWGLPDTEFEHRDGMVTKAEVRAVALGKLDLPNHGVVWDVGAGSGSVAIECARLMQSSNVYAVERSPEDASRIAGNADRHQVAVTVIEDSAPAALTGLPDPDRAFVGGGGLDVLDAVLDRLRPGGRVVATYAALDRAAGAADRLGALVQVGVARGERLPDGSWRLAAENPVFVCWGPQ